MWYMKWLSKLSIYNQYFMNLNCLGWGTLPNPINYLGYRSKLQYLWLSSCPKWGIGTLNHVIKNPELKPLIIEMLATPPRRHSPTEISRFNRVCPSTRIQLLFCPDFLVWDFAWGRVGSDWIPCFLIHEIYEISNPCRPYQYHWTWQTIPSQSDLRSSGIPSHHLLAVPFRCFASNQKTFWHFEVLNPIRVGWGFWQDDP